MTEQELLDKYGLAYEAVCKYDPDYAEELCRNFIGSYESKDDLCFELYEIDTHVSENLQPYMDWDYLYRDLQSSGNYTILEYKNQIYIYSNF
jgi:hypothetical protein